MQDYDLFTLWLIGGVALMVLELLIPGGIVFFLGLSAALVSLFLYLGLIDGWLQAFTLWFIGSLALVFGLRGVVQKVIPAQTEKGQTDEDLDAYSQVAEVCERIPVGGQGRISFRGSTWAAQSFQADRDLEVGTPVRIAFRDNLVWTVEPLDSGSKSHSQPPSDS